VGPLITLLGKPGCHLCDEAREVITKVVGDMGERGVRWEERDITRSAEDTERYWEQIPVTLIDGVQHDFWRVDETRLRAALLDRIDRAGQADGAGPG
jgi:glutaredoxin